VISSTSRFVLRALGDRIRLADHFLDPEVFIRSMGTRGLGRSWRPRCRRAGLDAAGEGCLVFPDRGRHQSR
jgi:putative protein kinase ArgK-like GTPase of G3E family